MRRSTIIVLLLAVLSVGAYYLIKYRKEAAPTTTTTPEATTQVAFLFDAAEGVPTSIRIEAKDGKVVEVARNADNAWVVKQPIEAAADQASAEAAASQVTALRVQNKIQNVDPEIMGLKTPEYVITIQFSSGKERKAEVGVITPSETGYYVRNENGEIVVISKDSLDTLLGMLTNPPYAPTPTPEVSVTETPLPSPTPEVTPTETATPTP